MKRLLALAPMLLGRMVLAQQQPAPPVFRAGTELVEIDVVVRDTAGRFVRDLKPEEIELRDEGQPRPVEVLSLVTGDNAEARSKVFVAIIDDAHLSRENFRHAQTAASELFSRQFHAGDIGGLVVGRQVANRRLTSDVGELAAAVKNATPNPKATSRPFELMEWPRMSAAEVFRVMAEDRSVIDGLVARACSDEPERCGPPLGSDAAQQEIRLKANRESSELRTESDRTLQIVSAMLTTLERFDGRKTIVLLSEGFAADESWSEVQSVVALAARVNARIYTLDARGLGYQASSALDRAPADTQQRLLDALGGSDDAINSLAADTGGFVVRNTNEFTRAVARIAEDAGTYYVIGYRPARAFDAKFHRVSVRVKRPRMDVRARRGYVAATRTAANETVSRELPAPPELVAADLAEAINPLIPPVETEPRILPVPRGSDPAASENAGVISESPAGLRLRPLASEHGAALGAGGASSDAATSGWEAYQRGDVEGARAALAPLATRPDTPSWVHYCLGQADYALARYRDAIGQWEAVRVAEPGFEPVYFDLVDGYLQVKDRAKAIAVLLIAEGIWPRDPDVYNALGVVHTAAGAIDDAVKAFNEAIEAAPTEPNSYLNLAIALEKRYSRSLRYFVPTRTYVGNDKDRDAAIENYRKYLEFGGPYTDIARRRLDGLKWAVTKKR
jgi:VWFA-related protein